MARRNADSAVAVQEQDEKDFEYPVTIEDAGPGAKKVSIEIPRDRIEKVMEQQFKELRQQAAIPGFRPGHAPQKLIEKRFQGDVKDQVRRQLISESYQQAVEKNNLHVIGGLSEFREHLGGELTITLLRAIGHGFEVHEMNLPKVVEAIYELQERHAARAKIVTRAIA